MKLSCSSSVLRPRCSPWTVPGTENFRGLISIWFWEDACLPCSVTWTGVGSDSAVDSGGWLPERRKEFLSPAACGCVSCFSRVWLFAAPWTVALQAPLSMGFSRQECWSGLPCPPPGDLPHPGIEPMSLLSPSLAGRFFTTSTTWEAFHLGWSWQKLPPGGSIKAELWKVARISAPKDGEERDSPGQTQQRPGNRKVWDGGPAVLCDWSQGAGVEPRRAVTKSLRASSTRVSSLSFPVLGT